MEIEVYGHCASEFEPVREAFIRNFEGGFEVGAATSVVIDGETVVDLWAGHADAARTRPWTQDTIVHVMSTTKGITALLVHRLVERGLIELDAPVATYWPEFARAGKESLPVRYLLTHQAGLPALDAWQPAGTLQNWSAMTELLAQQKPLWEPGHGFGYHAVTFGFLVGEVIRRASGKTVGQLIREEIAGPLAVDFELGFAGDQDHRVAEVLNSPPAPEGKVDLVKSITADLKSVLSRGFVVAIPTPDTDFNSRKNRAHELPSTNGHTNARALATIYGALARGGRHGGVQLLSAESIARATEKQVGGVESVMQADMHFGLGFGLRRPSHAVSGPRAFGHGGFGGSIGLADPDRKLGFGYVMNQFGLGSSEEFAKSTLPDACPGDRRATDILRAVYATLELR